MKKPFIILVLILAACQPAAPSEDQIQTAIAQTQAAAPTLSAPTDTPKPTETPAPTVTNTPFPTDTPTPTSTPTSTETSTATPDVRIINIESRAFLLEKDDLPVESQYYLPGSGWISPHHNTEILSARGEEEGRAYLEATKRIDGWWVYYKRGSQAVTAPEEIFHNIIQYETAQGAQLTITDYNLTVRAAEDGWVVMDEEVTLGDLSFVIIDREVQPSGKALVWMALQTAYRNYLSVVQGYGWEDEVRLEYLIEIQKIVLEKLENAPLSDP